MNTFKKATKADWKTKEKPSKRERLGYTAVFYESGAEKVSLGAIPREMEDKWFVYCEEGWLYFHRSWTGALIYWLKLEDSVAGVRVVESWVNRDPEEYRWQDIKHDRELLDYLIKGMLLGEKVSFPTG